MGENELYVIFDPDFIKDIETLGNSVTISNYTIEDLRTQITNVYEILSPDFPYYRYGEKDAVREAIGYFDTDENEFKTHISLPSGLYSNSVRDNESEFEIDDPENGNGLVRIIRFNYLKDNSATNNKTAFIITGNINIDYIYNKVKSIDPIECNQDRILLTVRFPDTTRANIRAAKIEKDTKFLESFGIFRGVNIFRDYTDDTLGTRNSSYRYLDYISENTSIEKKDVPYISDDGRCINRRDNFRIYTKININCSNLISNIQPKTRASLNKNGGILKIYGTLHYIEYEIKNTEFIYSGEGTEALDGIPDSELILTSHDNGLRDVSIENFYVSYGNYTGQPDPSVLVKARVKFYNPLTKTVETIESENIRLTQEDNVISQWEVIYRSTSYTEPTDSGNIPVYMFPWQSGYAHKFTIRTTLPNLNINRDFYLEYEDPDLSDYFDINIESIENRTYPITDYEVTIKSKIDNNDFYKWFPVINGESNIRLTTLKLRGYGYSESFYFVQSPRLDTLELHNSNNLNVPEIVLEYNQTSKELFPVALEADNYSEIGERDTWKIFDYSEGLEFNSLYGTINPNNPDFFDNKLIITSLQEPDSIRTIDLGKITIGRIKRSEVNNNFDNTSEWRNIVNLYTTTIPVKKRGIIENISSDNQIILKEINLYKINVISNGPFACWMEKSDDYCFFNPKTNQPTNTNYFYSRDFNEIDGVYVYIALHDTIALNEEPELENKILFTVTDTEPNWTADTAEDSKSRSMIKSRDEVGEEDNSVLKYFSDEENLAVCEVYRQAPDKIDLSYVDPKDMYVFLGSYEETELRFRSTETPTIDRLLILENSDIDQRVSAYKISSYNQITLLDSPTPTYTVIDSYKYHVQHIQNPNDLVDYYPIFPSCIYRAHSYNYSDVSQQFYLFRKALGPSFYRSDLSKSNNIVYTTSTPEINTNDAKRTIVIRSRYEIPDEEFVIDFDVPNSFEISSIDHTFLNSNDYKHQYVITLNTLATSTGGQRSLGVLIITSRIYSLINFTSFDTNEFPYIDLSQDDIDSIVPPSVMKISIIQEAGGSGNPSEIKVDGVRDPNISNSGEDRSFTITSNIPINDPQIDHVVGCSIFGESSRGFSFSVPSIVDGYEPVVPSETPPSYVSYSSKKGISFDLTITPVDSLTYNQYLESFSFRQPGITSGLIYASDNNSPKLYLGNGNSVIETVKPDIKYIDVFLGAFGINAQITEGTEGKTKGINISVPSGCSSEIMYNTCTYYNTNWKGNVRLILNENTTSQTLEKKFIITYSDTSLTHKITVIVRQPSNSGNIICSNNAYFLSHGECIESSDYSSDFGYFTFSTDIDIKSLSLEFPKGLLDGPYTFTPIRTDNPGGNNYREYQANIKLKPNLSNSTRDDKIFKFIKNGTDIVKSVYIHQGFYCLNLCNPGSTTGGVYSGQSMGSENNPILVPSRDNYTKGTTRKIFKLNLTRSEPIPETGKYTSETIDLTDISTISFPMVFGCTWNYPGTKAVPNISEETSEIDQEVLDRGSAKDGYLINYMTDIFQSDNDVDPMFYPFLENVYTVYSKYYSTEFPIRIVVDIRVEYPYSDPLHAFKRDTIHSYTIYLKKVAESNTQS